MLCAVLTTRRTVYQFVRDLAVEPSAPDALRHRLRHRIAPKRTHCPAARDRRPDAVEWRGGISPPRSPKTGHEPLDSSGSYRPTAVTSCQCESRAGCFDLSLFSQSHAHAA